MAMIKAKWITQLQNILITSKIWIHYPTGVIYPGVGIQWLMRVTNVQLFKVHIPSKSLPIQSNTRQPSVLLRALTCEAGFAGRPNPTFSHPKASIFAGLDAKSPEPLHPEGEKTPYTPLLLLGVVGWPGRCKSNDHPKNQTRVHLPRILCLWIYNVLRLLKD